MNTRAKVKGVVDTAAVEFEKCLALLAAMKSGRLLQHRGISLPNFQSTLATALFRLGSMYRSLSGEKDARVRAKATLSPVWFGRRMQFLSSQQQIVRNAINIGKAIGDGFAWFFYQNNRDFLLEHLKEPEQLLIPKGVGGFAELELVEQVKSAHGHFVLYHGITSILRLGDFSLVNLKDFRVVTIGELKAAEPVDGRLTITMFFPSNPATGDELQQTPRDTRRAGGTSKMQALPASARDRFARQLRRMVAAQSALRRKPDKNLSFQMDDRISVLREFLDNIPPGKCSFRHLGRSVLLVGYRLIRSSLYDRLRTSDDGLKAKLTGVEREAVKLTIPGRNDNSIYIGSWPFSEDGRLPHRPGMTHPLWWPLSGRALREAILQEVIVITIFNPAHLFECLENGGFHLEINYPRSFSARKRIDDRLFTLEGLPHYFQLIQDYFFAEEDIVAIIRKLEDQLQPTSEQQAARISLYIEQILGISGRREH
jgi:hypothetical protein